MPSSSSSSSSSSSYYSWFTLSTSLRASADSELDGQQQDTADAWGISYANTINSKIEAETGSPLSSQALADFEDYLSSFAMSLTNTAKSETDTAFANYPWSGGTSSPSTTMGMDSGPTADTSTGSPSWLDSQKTDPQNWGMVKADIEAKGSTSGPVTATLTAGITINVDNLSITVQGSVNATLGTSAGSIPVAGNIVLKFGRKDY